jgi:hypothetical protein
MDPVDRKEFFSKKLREPHFDVLTEEEKDFVKNVSLAGSSGETHEIMWEIAFLKTLLQLVERKVNEKSV